MNTSPDCPQPPVIIQQPIDCPLPPVTNTNQNICVDSSASDATLTSFQPSDSDASLSNATSKQASDFEYTQANVSNKPNTGYCSQSNVTSNQTSDYEYSPSRSNLTNKPNTDYQQRPIVIKECPLPQYPLPPCPLTPIPLPPCPLPPCPLPPCPLTPIPLPPCPLPPCPLPLCPLPPCPLPLCPLPPCPLPPPVECSRSRSKKVIKQCSRSSSRVIKESSRSSSKKTIKECPRSSKKLLKECPRSSKNVLKECPRSSTNLLKECPRSSKNLLKECPRSSKNLLKERPRSSKKLIKEDSLRSVVIPQNIECSRPQSRVSSKNSSQIGSVQSSVKSKQSTNYDRSLSNVPSQQASSVLESSRSTAAIEKESLLRSQSEPTLGQKSQVQSKVATAKSSHVQLNFELIRSESRLTLEQSLSQVLKPGLSGLREFMSSSLLTATQGSSFLESDLPHLNKFIDYFIECDGLRYMGILEQIEYDFEDRVKAALLNARPNTQAEAQYLRDKLVNIGQVQPAYQQISLKEIDFPELLNKEIKILSFDYKSKIDAIRRIHVYGLDMEKYWLTQLNTGKNVDKVEVYDIGTQMLAELMAQLFSLLVKSCEFLIEVNEDVKMYTGKLSAESLIHLFTEFRRLLVEEVGAVGETCGGVMVHIPYLKDDDIIEIMTKLYNQVNFVDICICRALKPVVPLTMLFDCQRASATTFNYS